MPIKGNTGVPCIYQTEPKSKHLFLWSNNALNTKIPPRPSPARRLGRWCTARRGVPSKAVNFYRWERWGLVLVKRWVVSLWMNLFSVDQNNWIYHLCNHLKIIPYHLSKLATSNTIKLVILQISLFWQTYAESSYYVPSTNRLKSPKSTNYQLTNDPNHVLVAR